MRATCPCCDAEFPIESAFADDDGKRLAAALVALDLELARATLRYLRLFKPPKSALRSARAARLVGDLAELVRPGTVCRDERSGVRRPAPSSLWVAAIEQMLTNRAALTLPLEGHNYLRAVAFGMADQADARAERDTRSVARRPTADGPSPIRAVEPTAQATLKWLAQMHDYGAIDDEEYAAQMARLRQGTDHAPG